MNCLSHGWGPAVLAPLPGLTWPWSCSTSRRCGCRSGTFTKRKNKNKKTVEALLLFGPCRCVSARRCQTEVPRPAVVPSYDHTTVRAPHPIRTAKLSTVGPDQYFGRGLQGNLGCCMSFCFNFISLLRTFIFLHPTFFCWPNFEKGASGAWYTK